jgi:hypothetical protein
MKFETFLLLLRRDSVFIPTLQLLQSADRLEGNISIIAGSHDSTMLPIVSPHRKWLLKAAGNPKIISTTRKSVGGSFKSYRSIHRQKRSHAFACLHNAPMVVPDELGPGLRPDTFYRAQLSTGLLRRLKAGGQASQKIIRFSNDIRYPAYPTI